MRVPVTSPSDAQRAVECARDVATSVGFSDVECEEIVLAAMELAFNLMKHGGGGTLTFTTAMADGRAGIRIESEDAGPGIPDIEQALTDGYSTAGGLGIGLGTVNRLMDDVELRALPTAGAHLVCHRWLRSSTAPAPAPWLDFGAASRSYRREKENGDAFLVRQWTGNALVAVIDGLGHGQFAQRAAQTARHYLEQHFDRPLADLFRGTSRACHATRGVVMALARFDQHARQSVTVASIGNISVRVFGGPMPMNIMARRGVLGLGAPEPRTTECPWTTGSILIMHSDGVKAHWDWEEFQGLRRESAGGMARRLLSVLGKDDDDATVLVVRSVSP